DVTKIVARTLELGLELALRRAVAGELVLLGRQLLLELARARARGFGLGGDALHLLHDAVELSLLLEHARVAIRLARTLARLELRALFFQAVDGRARLVEGGVQGLTLVGELGAVRERCLEVFGERLHLSRQALELDARGLLRGVG